MGAAIDDYFDGRGAFFLDDAMSNRRRGGWSVLKGGKRVFSALTFGSFESSAADGGDVPSRRRKCRRIDHSSPAPGLVLSVVPGAGALIGLAYAVFGPSGPAGAARKGGAIVSMVLDEERLCLYTLGARGFICTYDLAPLPGGGNSSTLNGSASASTLAASPPRLASVMDAPSTAKLYLDSVSRGRPSWHPWGPSSSPDCPCTRAWGVECTRDILKWHDFKGRSSKREIAGGS